MVHQPPANDVVHTRVAQNQGENVMFSLAITPFLMRDTIQRVLNQGLTPPQKTHDTLRRFITGGTLVYLAHKAHRNSLAIVSLRKYLYLYLF